MKTKVFYVIALMGFGVVSCSGSNNEGQANGEAEQVEEVQYDSVLGVGDFMDFKVEEGLNSGLALKGKGLYDSKCASCHSLKNDVIVGPGWSGVTERRQLGWLMNMMTNTTEMLEVIAQMQKLGIPTGPLPDGSPNLYLQSIKSQIEGVESERTQNSKMSALTPQQIVLPIGITIPMPMSGILL
jgi:hypothetical protein